MLYTSEALQELVEELSRLPGIGRKSAQRLALHIMKRPREEVARMANALVGVKDRIRTCSVCCNITEQDPCAVCASAKRDRSVVCVVEEPNDVMAIENTNEFRGVYHVLGGALSPLDGIGPKDIHLERLLKRAADGVVQEVMLATNFTVEGEATAHYAGELLRAKGLRVTRIARGLPVGGELEHVDSGTLAQAVLERRSI